MGKTSFSGPVYGAKSLLWYQNLEIGIVSTSVQTIAQMVIPAYQDFYFTELHAMKGSTGSTSLTVALSDDSSRATASTRTVASVAFASSTANAIGSTVPAADGGEYEGVRVAANSTLTLQLLQPLSSVAGLTSSGVSAWAFGFVRYIDSTRAA